ncbi:MAG: hypothetical protein Q4F57_09300 [Weeksellaceae bacterium]|nr:hypothetical protein [Weeksellaceae bacterium]
MRRTRFAVRQKKPGTGFWGRGCSGILVQPVPLCKTVSAGTGSRLIRESVPAETGFAGTGKQDTSGKPGPGTAQP